jgi:hypothetical protein
MDQTGFERSRDMAYRIEGLAPEAFESLFSMTDGELAQQGARRAVADGPGYPCRVSLDEAAPGEPLILINHVSHDAPTPFRASHAIYVRKDAKRGRFEDAVPPLFDSRTLGLRAFDAEGMLCGALLASPGDADSKIRELFERPEIVEVHAHTAALGCFLAKIERN